MFRLAHRYLSRTDRISEVAFAVFMVIIINGYVALSDLNTGFGYIVAVNVGACFGWGFIDGFVYFVISSMTRNANRRLLLALRKNPHGRVANEFLEESLSGSVFDHLDEQGQEAVLQGVKQHLPTVDDGRERIITREEALGWLSIVFIYMGVGLVLALPFLVMPDKLSAWVVSNLIGTAWLFWFGVQMGRTIGKYRVGLGLAMAAMGLLFLGLSYLVWT